MCKLRSRPGHPAATIDRASVGPVAALLAITGLWAFAVAQPLLALLGDEPGFFVVRGAGTSAIVTFATVLTFGPPLLLWLVGLGARRIRRGLGTGVHLATIAVLGAAAVAPLVRRAGVESTAACVLVAVLVAALFTWAYRRSPTVATWTRLTAILAPMSLFAFLVLSPTAHLMTDRATDDVAATGSDLPSVAFVVLDELPTESLLDAAGNIDELRFPNLAALGTSATWYRNSTTVATATEQAVPAMLSGKVPTATPPIVASHPDTLFSLLAPTHDLTVSESFTALCGSLCDAPGEPAGLAQQLNETATGSASVWRDRFTGTSESDALGEFAEEITAAPSGSTDTIQELYGAPTRFTNFLDAVQPSDDPSLWFLHLVLPHAPWRLYPDGSMYSATDFPDIDEGWWVASVLQQRHLYQARYTDQLVGELVEHLREIGEYDNTAIVIAADHGRAFVPTRPERLWSPETVDSIAYAPLFIKAPGQTTGGPDDRNVMTVDILPTIAEQLGLEIPWEMAGVPVDSPEVAARGDQKWTYDFGSLTRPTAGERHEFSLSSTRPSEDRRWVGERTSGAPPLSSLLEPLDVSRWLGVPIVDVATSPEPTAVTVDRPKRTNLGNEGFVTGRITDPPGDGRVLVAVDGVIVTASPIIELAGQPGAFLAMLPPDVLAFDTLDRVQLAIVSGAQVTPATVTLVATG